MLQPQPHMRSSADKSSASTNRRFCRRWRRTGQAARVRRRPLVGFDAGAMAFKPSPPRAGTEQERDWRASWADATTERRPGLTF